jgi:hypothetical protein
MQLAAATTRPARLRWPLIAASAMVAALSVLAVVLWARYGAAVFHEILTAGLALCF